MCWYGLCWALHLFKYPIFTIKKYDQYLTLPIFTDLYCWGLLWDLLHQWLLLQEHQEGWNPCYQDIRVSEGYITLQGVPQEMLLKHTFWYLQKHNTNRSFQIFCFTAFEHQVQGSEHILYNHVSGGWGVKAYLMTTIMPSEGGGGAQNENYNVLGEQSKEKMSQKVEKVHNFLDPPPLP